VDGWTLQQQQQQLKLFKKKNTETSVTDLCIIIIIFFFNVIRYVALDNLCKDFNYLSTACNSRKIAVITTEVTRMFFIHRTFHAEII